MVRWTDAGPEAHPEAAAFVRVVARVLPQLARRLDLPGVRLESKGPVVAVHYRQAEDLEGTRQTVLRELGRIAERTGLAVLEGRRVVELRPPRLGKGWCVEQLVAEHPFSGIVCIGDDKTDAEAFRALAVWRESASDRQAVTVGVANPEIPAMSSWEPDFVVGGVQAVERLLLALADEGERSQ
jgi:trehalose 6-phosphate phosphatase